MDEDLKRLVVKLDRLKPILLDQSHPMLKDIRLKNEDYKKSLAGLVISYLLGE